MQFVKEHDSARSSPTLSSRMQDMYDAYKNFTSKKFKLIVKLSISNGSNGGGKLRTSHTSELLK